MTTYAAVIADAHLDGDNAELEAFLAFLQSLGEKPHLYACYILGDLFNLWLGAPGLQLSHQRPVLEALEKLKNRGIVLKYIEGNRDYFLAPSYLNHPFHEIASEGIHEIIGKNHFYFAHGDLVNVHDRQYRLWRKFSRNRFIYAGFTHLPHVLAVPLARYLETSFRGTNLRHKAIFPAETCEEYATMLFQKDVDIVVLGHFHEGWHQEFSMQGRSKHLYVVPAWKDEHAYLRIISDGNILTEMGF